LTTTSGKKKKKKTHINKDTKGTKLKRLKKNHKWKPFHIEEVMAKSSNYSNKAPPQGKSLGMLPIVNYSPSSIPHPPNVIGKTTKQINTQASVNKP
jgi:hypothetical protein